jgi:calcium binding protein 39
MLGRLFGADDATSSWPARVQELCGDLSDSLQMSSSSTEQVRQCLQAAISAFDAPASTAIEKQDLLSGLLQSDLPAKMLEALPNLDFEARKDVMRLFSVILQLGGALVFEYVRTQEQILQLLLEGCGNPEVALHSHMMLRNCCKHAELLKIMLEHGFATREDTGLLKLARHSMFDISSDAFSSLRDLLLTHKAEAAQYLELHFREFFTPYNELLQVQDYVAKRQALRLLGEILLDRKFMKVMLDYVGDEQFLQIHMNLLRETGSKAIQADAFHIFKIFAANPKKPARVHQILLKNRERLIKLLDSLGKEAGESFAQDRKAVVQALKALEALPAVPGSSPAVSSTTSAPTCIPDKANVSGQEEENRTLSSQEH